MKSIAKEHMTQSKRNVKATLNEIETLRFCNHPHILKLHHVYETEHHVHLVTDYHPNGELFSRIYKRKKFTEPAARSFMKGLLETL